MGRFGFDTALPQDPTVAIPSRFGFSNTPSTPVKPLASFAAPVIPTIPQKTSTPQINTEHPLQEIARNLTNEPVGKDAENVAKQFTYELPAHLPFVGGIIQSIRDDPETALNLKLSDFGPGSIQGTKEFGQGLVKAPLSPILDAAGIVQGNKPINIKIPGLGDVNNAQFRAAARVQNGEDPFAVIAEEGGNEIFNTLFLIGLTSKFVSPRPVTIASAEAPEGVTTTQGPKSFREFKSPEYNTPITPEFVDKMRAGGAEIGPDYNPKLPTFFQMKGDAGGKVTAEIVQLKPSYLSQFKGVFTPENSNPISGLPTLFPKEAVTTIYSKAVDGLSKLNEVYQATPNKQGGFVSIPNTGNSNGSQGNQIIPKSPEEAASIYKQNILDKETQQGGATVIAADNLKDHFNDYNDSNHPIYSKAAFQLYQQALKENPNPVVKLTGGGPGSGKTELVNSNLAKNFNGIIYDSNLSNYEGAVKQIDAARNAGKNVEIYGVLPNLERARHFTLSREDTSGRGISDKTFAQGHTGFPETVKRLLDEGLIDPGNVHLLDTRNIPNDKALFQQLISKGIFSKDPVALLNKVRYNKENVTTISKAIREKYQSSRGQSGFSYGSPSPLSQNRPDVARPNVNQGRDRANIEGQRIRPEQIVPVQANERPVIKSTSPTEELHTKLLTQRSILQEALDNNPVKKLARYANRNGELPEVLDKEGSKFGKMGDEIASQFGFPDSETARLAYENYRLQKKRLDGLNIEIVKLRDTIQKNRLEDQDAKSLAKILEGTAKKTDKEIQAIASGKGLPPGVQKAQSSLRRLGAEHLEAVLQATYNTTPPLTRETPQHLLQLTQESYNIKPEEFAQIGSGDPFNKMVVDVHTPVKAKVGMLDYFRTPDRVLKKIGLGSVATHLRRAYENYIMELPIHLDVITDWKNRIPDPQGNVRIFRHLDGQHIRDYHAGRILYPLDPEELKVAKEIKYYLKEWANRLGLPEDNQISHYITHVFNIAENEKEFDEDLARIIGKKIPGSVYDPFLEKRLGKKGYIEDTWKALDAYAKRAVRKANMDPALNELKEAGSRLEESQEKYLKRLGDRINLRPTEVDNLIDNTLKQFIGYRFGQRPVAYLSRVARRTVSRAFLGLNFGSALKTLTQVVNTYAILGEKYTIIGYSKLLTQMGNKELVEQGVLGQDMIQDRALSAAKKTMERVDKGLYILFDTAEKINRGAAYWGAKQKALNKGASEQEAILYAKKIVRDTQFAFGSIDTPVGLNSDITKLLTQFMTYGVKQTEFASEMVKDKNYAGIIRYIAASLALVYFFGKAFNLKWTDFVPGYSIATRFGSLPPSLAIPGQILNSVFSGKDNFGNVHPILFPDKKGGPTRAKDIAGTVIGSAVPAGTQLQKTIGGLKAISNPQNKIKPTVFNTLKAAILGKQNLTQSKTAGSTSSGGSGRFSF